MPGRRVGRQLRRLVAGTTLSGVFAACATAAMPAHVSPAIDAALRAGGKDGGLAVIVTLRADDVDPAARSRLAGLRRAVMDALPRGRATTLATYDQLPALALRIDAAALAALRGHPAVLAINPDHRVRPALAQSRALIQVGAAHGVGLGGDGISVAIIDTGVDSNGGVVHPGLADDLVAQRCFRSENDCVGGPADARDQTGHGTHVAGILTGPQGVAPDARFLALKVFTTGDSSDGNILAALDHVIGLNVATPGSVDLINMSLSGDPYPDEAACNLDNAAYLAAFDALRAQGVSIFVATGNQSRRDAVASPACVSGAIGIGAVDDANFGPILLFDCSETATPDKVACFSNATPRQGVVELVDLLGPGCLVQSLGLNGGSAAVRCGTSMSTPHAAGVAALAAQVLAANAIAAPPPRLEEFLEANAQPVADLRLDEVTVFPRVAVDRVMGALALGVPADVVVTASSPGGVSLQWSAVPGADAYRVHRLGSRDAALAIGTVTAPTTAFLDATPPCGTSRYVVTARSGTLESIASPALANSTGDCPFDAFADGFER